MQESLGMKTLELVFFDAGGGHRSAANALCEVVRRQERPWEMRMMNLQELLDEMDVFRKVTGLRLQDLYNLMLRRGWTLGSPIMMKGMHAVIRALHPKEVSLLTEFWRRKIAEGHQPDVVVSVIPNFNRALFDAIQEVMPDVPLVTILTDMADYPPHFWIERQPQYLICGTERARRQALDCGHAQDHVSRSRRG
jgi:Monogalactosyldiacylglycerol (MGDG) synthase